MAVSVPSAALAWDDDVTPDSVLTVQVNMGSNDAGDSEGGDSDLCTGFSTIALSSTVLQSRPDVVQPGVANPNIRQRLAALATGTAQGRSLSLNDTVNHDNDSSTPEVLVLTKSSEVSGSWIINSAWANVENAQWSLAQELAQISLQGFDWQNQVLSFSAETPSLAMIDRRTYVTSPFTLSYDASTCASDSTADAEVEVERTDLEVRSTVNGRSEWISVELDWERSNPYDVRSLLEIAADGGYRGEAMLLKARTQSDGDRRIGPMASSPGERDDGDWSSSIYGVSGVVDFRAVTKLYGDLSQNAQFRTQFGFWMEVYPNGD